MLFRSMGTERFAIINSAASNVFSSIDNNDYFTTAPHLGYMTSANVLNLAAWKVATGKDVNSISADPLFTSLVSLVPGTLSPVIGKAVPLPGQVNDDILGVSRSTIA